MSHFELLFSKNEQLPISRVQRYGALLPRRSYLTNKQIKHATLTRKEWIFLPIHCQDLLFFEFPHTSNQIY